MKHSRRILTFHRGKMERMEYNWSNRTEIGRMKRNGIRTRSQINAVILCCGVAANELYIHEK